MCGAYTIAKLNMIRYFHDTRTYGPTVIQLSGDENFNNPITVYNSDIIRTVYNLEVGTEAEYIVTLSGKGFVLDSSVMARYIRIYVNRRTNSTSKDVVEFEAYSYLAQRAKKIFRDETDRGSKMITSGHISGTANM